MAAVGLPYKVIREGAFENAHVTGDGGLGPIGLDQSNVGSVTDVVIARSEVAPRTLIKTT